MATNFPTSLDSLTNPAAGDSLSSPSHAAQHSNVNDAVEALQAKVGVDGSAVTGSLDYKVANQGLTLVKSQTIGSGVSSVTVTDAFSATFNNYRVIISGVTSSISGSVPRLQLGSTTTGYYNAMLISGFGGGAPTGLGVNNGNNWYLMTGNTSPASMSVSVDIYQPNMATITTFCAHSTSGGNSTTAAGQLSGSTQYTSFVFANDSGTLTGGTIRVYGYNNG
jgi:hypothetical protein